VVVVKRHTFSVVRLSYPNQTPGKTNQLDSVVHRPPDNTNASYTASVIALLLLTGCCVVEFGACIGCNCVCPSMHVVRTWSETGLGSKRTKKMTLQGNELMRCYRKCEQDIGDVFHGKKK